jgi:drug/metabolite transporter (DMT)-like permease
MRNESPLPTIAALLGAMMLWASSFAALKYTFESFEPFFVIFARMCVALLFVLAVFPRTFRGLRPDRGEWKWLLLMALFEPGLYFLFEAEALANTSASQAGMITAMLPILVAIGAWLWIGERLTRRILFGGFLAISGAIWLSLAASKTQSAPHPLYGNFMEFLAMLTAAGYTLTLKHLTRKFRPLFLTAFQALVGTLFFGIVMLLTGTPLPESLPAEPSLAILYLGIAVTFGAYGLYNYGVSRIPASRASLYVNLIPLFAVLLAWLLLDERPGWQELLGGALILGGVWIAQREEPKIAGELADPNTPKGV